MCANRSPMPLCVWPSAIQSFVKSLPVSDLCAVGPARQSRCGYGEIGLCSNPSGMNNLHLFMHNNTTVSEFSHECLTYHAREVIAEVIMLPYLQVFAAPAHAPNRLITSDGFGISIAANRRSTRLGSYCLACAFLFGNYKSAVHKRTRDAFAFKCMHAHVKNRNIL